jgi:hypothetical protein
MIDLLQPKFDVNAREQTEYGHTALHYAALRDAKGSSKFSGVRTQDVINKVLQHGGNPLLVNNQKV